jgi:phosphate transport system substrate-binding protein
MMAGKGRMPLSAVIAVFLLGLTAACASGTSGTAGTNLTNAASDQPAASGPVSLKETGSTLLAPLISRWAATYQQQTPGVTISTAATSSGTGIKEASAGTADIGTSDAYLSSGDLVKNPSLLNIPLVVSAQQVNYNVPGFNGQGTHINLDGHVLAEIYSGTIRTWDAGPIAALNKGVHLPPTPIVPLVRSGQSGDTFLFTSYLSTQDTAWNSAIGYGTSVAWPKVPGELTEPSNTKIVDTCGQTPGCVAYAGISYLDRAIGDGCGYAALANAAGTPELPAAPAINASVASFVSSTPPNETISMVDGPARLGYPIVNYEYAIVSTKQPDPAKARAIRAFLSWVITTGNSMTYLQQVRFERLPDAVVALADQQIARIG